MRIDAQEWITECNFKKEAIYSEMPGFCFDIRWLVISKWVFLFRNRQFLMLSTGPASL